ncbi:hypothetical protein P175DRAFT_0468530 [Aspergillus ochraceoroseus IBT 24754]|uniref:Uncharacterized protein n=2 Tax=Aspergillus ochraceoroseus TaxID=138278 RepID=A0A2T5M5C9_9EURO|nr:uncharacterized protein P175DRAFT_0468530 [Aspergillus ochraceoroseus IBT 24754]KKK22515.1 hypothetical protein AOCH_001731 [Aspergillus ochraceoroseus]PTU23735.1 hypothetical protein P175DRAFT_0468530 [Aspergillus ochraceoroseus IBT 24754]
MASFLNFPDEILLLIVSSLDTFRDSRALLSVCLTSKKLCAIAQSVLYTEYSRSIHCHCCHGEKTKPGRLIPFIYFIRTLISRPDLAARVRSIAIDAREFDTDALETKSANIDVDTIGILAKGFQRLPVRNRDKLLMDAMMMKTNPFILMAAFLMPNLNSFQVSIGGEGLVHLEPLYRADLKNGRSSAYLSQIKSLSIEDFQRPESMVVENLIHLLHLPKLEEVSFEFLDAEADNFPTFDIPPWSLNVSHLTFKNSCLDSGTLTNLVAACKCLQSFFYKSWWNEEPSVVEFSADELGLILSSQANNLRFICVAFEVTDLSLLWEDYPKFSSFASFTNLFSLDIEQRSLEPSTEFPASLTTLVIRCCEFPIFQMLEILTERSESDLVNLEVVLLEPKFTVPNGMLGIARRFSHADITNNRSCRLRFRRAYTRVKKIVEMAGFVLGINHQTWDDFQMGEI